MTLHGAVSVVDMAPADEDRAAVSAEEWDGVELAERERQSMASTALISPPRNTGAIASSRLGLLSKSVKSSLNWFLPATMHKCA